MKTFNLIDDLKVIQFDGTLECKDKLEEVFYDYAPIEWEWQPYSDKIKLKDFPRLYNEVVEGDYIVEVFDIPIIVSADIFEMRFKPV